LVLSVNRETHSKAGRSSSSGELAITRTSVSSRHAGSVGKPDVSNLADRTYEIKVGAKDTELRLGCLSFIKEVDCSIPFSSTNKIKVFGFADIADIAECPHLPRRRAILTRRSAAIHPGWSSSERVSARAFRSRQGAVAASASAPGADAGHACRFTATGLQTLQPGPKKVVRGRVEYGFSQPSDISSLSFRRG